MDITWRKVWRDLMHNRLRTFLVVVSTTVGVFALGMVFGLSGVMKEQMTAAHRTSNAPHLEFYTSWVDQEAVEAVLREPGVADVEGEVNTPFYWKLPGEEEWRNGQLAARRDWDTQRMYPMTLLEGDWPRQRVLGIERMSAEFLDLPVGSTIVVQIGQRERGLTIGGIVRHPYVPPPQMGFGYPTFVATQETAAWLLNLPEGFDLLNVQIGSFDQQQAQLIGERIVDRLEGIGISVGYWDVVDPEVHWGQQMMDGVLLILQLLGWLSLALSGFLVINVMNAMVVQQVWQIGVMKVVGGTRSRVVRIYLMTALMYGALSLVVAVPLGAVAAHYLAIWMLDAFNIVFDNFQLIWSAVILQMAIALIVPLLAALVPVLGGTRSTAHEAIRSHGLGTGFGEGGLDRLTGRLRSLPRPLALSLRNTFRHKARVSLTLIALTLGGMMFIVVLTSSSSFDNTIDVLFSDFGFDLLYMFGRPYHAARLSEVATGMEGVSQFEVWHRSDGQLALPGGDEMVVGVWGVPADSGMFVPRIVSGRALLPEDDHAILLNLKIAEDEGFQVGDQVELTIAGRESTWTVVGLIQNSNNDFRDNFVASDDLADEIGMAGKGAMMVMTLDSPDLETQLAVSDRMRDAYAERNIEITYVQSQGEYRAQNKQTFGVLTSLMMVMAILAAVVGSVGLTSTMSINVVERSREIGVMRSVGATSLAIVGIFVVEGILIGLISWLFAIPISYPTARLFSHLIGEQIVGMPLDFRFSLEGVAVWFVLVVIFATLASLWPSLRATRVSVRQSLAYE